MSVSVCFLGKVREVLKECAEKVGLQISFQKTEHTETKHEILQHLESTLIS